MNIGLVKTWKKRWFVFDKETGELFYHLSESSAQPIGVINIAHCEVHRDTSSKREFTIHYTTVCILYYSLVLLEREVVTFLQTGRIYYLIAGSEQDVSFWIANFMEWKGKRKNTFENVSPPPSRPAVPAPSSRSFTVAVPRTGPSVWLSFSSSLISFVLIYIW